MSISSTLTKSPQRAEQKVSSLLRKQKRRRATIPVNKFIVLLTQVGFHDGTLIPAEALPWLLSRHENPA